MQVAALGRAVLDGLASAGVVGVVKHIPGHGRALVDSHKELPIVTASAEELGDRPRAIRAPRRCADGDDGARRLHRLGPERPVEQSETVIQDIVRGRIGFDGFLMSDDIGMEALQGDMGSARRGVVAAGCDVALHCSGKMEEMVAVASRGPGAHRGWPRAARAGHGLGPRRRRRARFRERDRQARHLARPCLVIHNGLCFELRSTTRD